MVASAGVTGWAFSLWQRFTALQRMAGGVFEMRHHCLKRRPRTKFEFWASFASAGLKDHLALWNPCMDNSVTAV